MGNQAVNGKGIMNDTGRMPSQGKENSFISGLLSGILELRKRQQQVMEWEEKGQELFAYCLKGGLNDLNEKHQREEKELLEKKIKALTECERSRKEAEDEHDFMCGKVDKAQEEHRLCRDEEVKKINDILKEVEKLKYSMELGINGGYFCDIWGMEQVGEFSFTQKTELMGLNMAEVYSTVEFFNCMQGVIGQYAVWMVGSELVSFIRWVYEEAEKEKQEREKWCKTRCKRVELARIVYDAKLEEQIKEVERKTQEIEENYKHDFLELQKKYADEILSMVRSSNERNMEMKRSACEARKEYMNESLEVMERLVDAYVQSLQD